MNLKHTSCYKKSIQQHCCTWLSGMIFMLLLIYTQAQSPTLPPPVFSHQRGFYEHPFAVEITSEIAGVQIYYTTDGSEPGENNGSLYSAPVEITTTTIVRARSIQPGNISSRITTHTYLFLEDVITQANNPPGYPSQWGPYTAIAGNAIADYEMDPEITQNPAYKELMNDALLSIPTMSLVTNKGNLFAHSTNPDTGGIYIYTGPPENNDIPGLGIGWERPASIEFFNSDGSQEFQVDCGVRLQGGHSRRAEKSPKHSFRLVFKSQYGPTKLDYPLFGEEGTARFNTVTLRAGFGNTWHHWSSDERRRAQYERDVWAKDTQRAMGHLSGHGIYVHLYINGIYWGLYNPTERIDREFAESYLGAAADNYDVIKDYAQVVDGTITAWNEMIELANSGLANNENYQRIQGKNPDGTINPDYEPYLDMVNFIDYMILNFYGGNTDWDHHNWIAIRNRIQPGRGFIFFSWDAEHVLKDLSHNMLDENNNNCPSHLYQKLRENQDFRRLFADRVQLHCFNNGILTPAAVRQRWQKRMQEIELAIIAESARWGDYRRDVHQFDTGPFELYSKDTWLTEQSFLLDQYFPNRTAAFLSQLKQAGLFPNVSAPVFLINGQPTTENIITVGDILTMTSATGDIYYTTDGTDPLLPEAPSEENQFVLIAENTDKRVLVPKKDTGSTWRSDINYEDSGWRICSGAPGGVGYERDSGYEDMITLDVGGDMHETGNDPNSSCYIRIKFTLTREQLEHYKTLKLQAWYDDGFVAYLNNRKIFEVNVPVIPDWNSVATASHEATSPESYDLTRYMKSLLIEGVNLLAIQAMNTGTSSSDFIINCTLVAGDQDATAGTVSPDAVVYSDPLPLNQSTHIKARTLSGNEWSAAHDMVFVIPQELNNLKVTEIHYHPLAGDSLDHHLFEFIELKNTGTSVLELSGLRFCRGISYAFPVRTRIRPNEFIVLASNKLFFAMRYGFTPFGEYDGYLNNGGETVALIDAAGDTLFSIHYNNRAPWPVTADGAGYSLVPKELDFNGDPNDPSNWQASYAVHGSPGKDDRATTFVESIISGKPEKFQLYQNYPNPFNPKTVIRYALPVTCHTDLVVYNLLGQKVATLVSEKQQAGRHQVEWHADGFASGLYFYRLQAGAHNIQTNKMLLIR
jgi:hypothetical protein